MQCWWVSLLLMFLTQSQFKSHVCSEKMKCLIGDCLKNSKSVCLSSDATFLLHNSSKSANLHLFNASFTGIAQSFKIRAVDSLECTSYIQRQTSFSLLYTTKDAFHAFSLKNGEGQASTQEISARANLQNDSFKVLSPAIVLSERDEAAIAYTEQDQFHLLLIEVKDRKRALRCLKLSDLNRPTGLISWITRQRAPHFENVRILPFLAIDANSFRVLCIRDNSAGVFSVSFNEKEGSIKQAFICNAFQKAITRDGILLSLLALPQSNVLLVYSAKQRLLLVKMKIQNDESSLIIDTFKTNIPVSCLKALASKENLYVSTYDEQTSTYRCFRSPLSELSSLTKDYAKLQPLLQSKDPIDFTANSRQFFIISSHSILMVEDDCILNHNIPSEEIRIQSYESWVERTYSRRMKKMVQQRSYKELQQVCMEKERKLIEQFGKVERSGGQNQAVKQRLAQLIICTHIVKLIIANRHFEQLLLHIEHPNISSQLSQSNSQNLLDDTLIEQTPALIQALLRLILRMDMYLYLNAILEEIIKHSHKESCRDGLNFIFCEVCETAIQFFPQSKRYNLNQYKELLQNTFDSIDVDEGCCVEQLSCLAQSKDNSKFLRNLVLNYKMIECFKQLFLTTDIEFQAEDVTEMVSSLEETARQDYLRDFFTELKQAYAKEQAQGKAGVDLKQRCAILMKGLLGFQEEVEGILKNTFPGLCAYFYLSQNKKHYSQQINTIASQCRDPKVAYLLFLSTLNEHNKSQLENLEKLRVQSQSSILQPALALAEQSLVS